MKNFALLFLIFSSTFCFAQEKVPYPIEDDTKVVVNQEVPDDLKGLVWNKWSTKNFIILSIDKDQGRYLRDNIEDIKNNLLDQWGLRNFDFKSECKIVCVSNKKLLKRIFRLENSKVEIRKNENNSCVVWFCLEDKNLDLPTSELMDVCLFQLEQNAGSQLPFYCKKGMCVLSQNIEKVKNELNKSTTDISIDQLIQKNEENLKKEEVDSFRTQSAVVCLLLRKEFGQDNFLDFLSKNDFSVFGLKDNKKLNEIINRYNKNLVEDLSKNKTPDEYLKIKNRR